MVVSLRNSTNKQQHISVEDREFSKKLSATHKFLKVNQDIFFTNADKGNMTVCLKKDDYVKKMENILSDKSTYTVFSDAKCL